MRPFGTTSSRWPFEARGLTNDPALNLHLALAGVGLALAREDVVRPYIERGDLVTVLEEFSTAFPASTSTTPRHQASPALHALIDCLLQLRMAADGSREKTPPKQRLAP